jgi:phosphoserine phosphatase RsbU/P
MYAVLPELTAEQVLQTFHRDAPYLFLGAAFVAVGVISGAFAAIRRKRDSLLIYFALFATLYGLRLWIQAGLLNLTVQGSTFYPRLREGIDYIVPVPAFLFLNATGLLTRVGRIAGYPLIVGGTLLAAATFAFGPANWFRLANNIVVIIALSVLVVQFLLRRHIDRDSIWIRRGLIFFAAFALVDNVLGAFRIGSKIEPTVSPDF